MYSRFLTARQCRKAAAALVAAAVLAVASLAQAADGPDRRTTAPAWCTDRCDALVIDWNATAYQREGLATPIRLPSMK